MTTVALIYTRVSSEEQAREGLSLEAQLGECRKYAAARAATHDWVLGREFQDILKGTRDDRPEYQALLADVRALRAAGRRVAVVVAALDRSAEPSSSASGAARELKGLGVPTHSVREGRRGLRPGGQRARLGRTGRSSAARRAGVCERQHTTGLGWFMVGRAPWGYRSRPATAQERAEGAPHSVLEQDPVTAPYVVETFERATRESVRSVARWVTRLPTAARGGRPAGVPRGQASAAEPDVRGPSLPRRRRRAGATGRPLAGPGGRCHLAGGAGPDRAAPASAGAGQRRVRPERAGPLRARRGADERLAPVRSEPEIVSVRQHDP